MSDITPTPVTFLMCDIEESTRLVASAGADYPAILNAVRRVLREAIERHGGVEVDAHGDELLAAFGAASAAVAAAVDAQRDLVATESFGSYDVRVRMGAHAGVAFVTEDGYSGIDVHRVARITSAGHGGQILVSAATHEVLPGVTTRDLGNHRLAGLAEPEQLFQLLADGLPRDFPPLRNTVAMLGNAMRVVIAEDSVLLREGVVRLLRDSGFDVVAQSDNADDLLRHVAMHKPDVAIVDIRMPPTYTDEGLVAAREIRSRFPAGVLVLSQYVEPGYAIGLLEEGTEGVGYLLKDRVSDVEEFAAAVRRVGEGGSALDPTVVSQLVGRRRANDPLDALTPREREALELMAEGRSNQAIAERMFVTLRAVEKHITSIFTKLDLPASSDDHRRVLAVLTFLRE